MAARIALGLTALFWVTMTALLWRAEYGPRDVGADAVPVRLVWRKILTAPDPSSLSIWQGERRLGFGHWVTSVGEEFAALDEAPPEGILSKVRHHQLKFDGNLAWPGEELRLRFECAIKLSTNQAWQEFTLRVSARPLIWEVRALAAEQKVYFYTEDGDRKFDRVFRFAELQNPQKLMAEFAGPAGFGLLAALGMPAQTAADSSFSPELNWEASSVFLAIGHEPIRVFRLQTRLLDRFSVRIFVSRAGEILRVELPNGVVLKHDQINVRTPDRS
jgi:hypothetical protein